MIQKPDELSGLGALSKSSSFQTYQAATSLCCINSGAFDCQSDRDLLFLGHKTGLVAYDPYNNVDVYYKDLPDGANAVLIYSVSSVKEQNMLLAGGNCSIIGLNDGGCEVFWTVTGDSVCSLCSINSAGDKSKDFVVGSEDYDIRIFHGDAIRYEITESDSKNKPICFASYDINQDNCPELICGWSNGKVEARTRSTGGVVFKTQLDSSVAGLAVGDYGGFVNILIACSVEGEIRGYAPLGEAEQMDTVSLEEMIRQLNVKKRSLLLELKGKEDSKRVATMTPTDIRQADLTTIPADTTLQVKLEVNPEGRSVDLSGGTSNGIPLRCVIIFAEGIFPGESHVIYPAKSRTYSSSYCMQLRPPRDSTVDLFIKGYAIPKGKNPSQKSYHVLTSNVLLPQFAMYGLISDNAETQWPEQYVKPKSGVLFSVSERPQRLASWLNTHFLLPHELCVHKQSAISVAFKTLRPPPKDATEGHVNKVSSRAGDEPEASTGLVIISMTKKGEANAHQVTRQQILADIADKTEQIKSLILRAENTRLTGMWSLAKQAYTELYYANRELLLCYKSRTCEYETLTTCQRGINQIIEQASSLRAGRYKTQTVSLCRESLKTGNIGALGRIIRTGGD
ncbi:unnamed protein product [Calicophoron daubneyi]|uniref:Bardet-Biedl syndrome 2 protein homolog n=1 Tax=Calicophoron daubneyi TaxID=300641 RepID=A0AAV2T8W9_CALDB